ncbi:glycosyltransferase family 92 protein [Neorhizobium sp. NCHU2750]|uniref:glycosyltransferase family 92 protein n=1 Tax=Neorhizobium sp. NCHU2750 TaxID=1825976 RepID=UPI000E71EDB4|nr:glycosyltransferase involved in cell wall biogenesis [Neorhizobium sp. NCHU2750]
MHLFGKKPPPFSKHLMITPPEAKPDRHGVAIVAMVKDEADYIADWAIFHRAVGVRHFYIYDNGSVDDSIAILRSILPPEELTIAPWVIGMTDVAMEKPINAQVLGYAHAILNYGADYRWMAFIDVDEFLLPKTGNTVEEALASVEGFPNISLPWHMFATSGHKTKPSGSILRNFTLRGREPICSKKATTNFKCVVDPCAVNQVSVHLFGTARFGEISANDAGTRATRKKRRMPSFYSAENLQLNHYYSKSEEELKAKLSRGPVSPATRRQYEERVMTAVRNIECDQIEDLSMVQFLDRTGIRLSGE